MAPLKYSIIVASVLLSLTQAVAESGSERAPPFLDCAKRDAQFTAELDYYGEMGGIPGEQLYQAFLTMLRARCACNNGRTAEGLALYNSVFGATVARQSQ
jgi:hypothetical protein